MVVSVDWKRFKLYRDCIRSLLVGSGDLWVSGDFFYVNTPDRMITDPVVFRALSCRDTLLSNLQSLHWWECKEIRLVNAPLFLGPKLVTFSIRLLDYGSDTSAVASILTALRTKSPGLEALEVCGKTQNLQISNALLDLLYGLSQHHLH